MRLRRLTSLNAVARRPLRRWSLPGRSVLIPLDQSSYSAEMSRPV